MGQCAACKKQEKNATKQEDSGNQKVQIDAPVNGIVQGQSEPMNGHKDLQDQDQVIKPNELMNKSPQKQKTPIKLENEDLQKDNVQKQTSIEDVYVAESQKRTQVEDKYIEERNILIKDQEYNDDRNILNNDQEAQDQEIKRLEKIDLEDIDGVHYGDNKYDNRPVINMYADQHVEDINEPSIKEPNKTHNFIVDGYQVLKKRNENDVNYDTPLRM